MVYGVFYCLRFGHRFRNFSDRFRNPTFFGKLKRPLSVWLSSIERGIVLETKEPKRPLTARSSQSTGLIKMIKQLVFGKQPSRTWLMCASRG